MDAAKCDIFLKVLDRGSFSRVAEELGYTPSGVSRSIAALEEEVGFPLLVRSRSGIQPTENGRQLIPIFRQMVYWDEQCQQVSGEIRGVEKGNITIGANYSVSFQWLPRILARFEEDYPQIHVQILEGCGQELRTYLEERRVDFCLSSRQKGPWEWLPLRDDALVAWLPESHPLAQADAFPLSAFNDEPFILTLPGRNSDTEQLLERHNIHPYIKFTTVDSFATYSMVEEGLGVSINNDLIAKNWKGRVKVLPLDPPQPLHLGILVPSLSAASPAARKCIQCVQQVLPTLV
ncbi:MAG: LysR family transcriptional regulator [Oscillospiraceae bacterium]|nr:LysR family transcriptional regulator [Oscillospiraceae bacterium]